MNNAFEILAGFLERGETEVEGRALEEPPELTKAKLRDFARGTLPESEQPELIEQLNRHRHWMKLLATEAKALRNQSGDLPDRPAQ